MHLNEPMYRPARWVASLFIAGALAPWVAGAAAFVWSGPSVAAAQRPGSTFLIVVAGWNYLLTCVIPPLALMLAARTRRGPVTWGRLPDGERRVFSRTMLATVWVVSCFFFVMLWPAYQMMIVPVMVSSVVVALVGSMAGILAGTAMVALRRSLRGHQRKTRMPPATLGRRHPV